MARQQPQLPSRSSIRQWFMHNLNSNLFFQIIITLLLLLVGYIVSVWSHVLPSPIAAGPSRCQINASELSIDKTVVEVNRSIKVSVRADNPEGQALLYDWHAVNGEMNPGLRSNAPQSTYTAPAQPVNDTISVDVTLPNCASVRRSK